MITTEVRIASDRKLLRTTEFALVGRVIAFLVDAHPTQNEKEKMAKNKEAYCKKDFTATVSLCCIIPDASLTLSTVGRKIVNCTGCSTNTVDLVSLAFQL